MFRISFEEIFLKIEDVASLLSWRGTSKVWIVLSRDEAVLA